MDSNIDTVDNTDITPKESTPKVYSTHTKFCAYGLSKCRKGSKCIYAHTFKELNPITCKWNEDCLRKEKCYFKHNNESKIQYVKRAFAEDLKRLNIILHEKKHKNKPVVQFKDEQKEEENNFDEDEYKRLTADFHRMYYDPSFEYYSWAEIDEFDSDNDIH